MNIQDQNNQGLALINTKKLLHKISFSRTKLYLLMQTNNFPKPIRLSKNCILWNLAEIDSWVEQLMTNRE